jgi:hypothetical protein
VETRPLYASKAWCLNAALEEKAKRLKPEEAKYDKNFVMLWCDDGTAVSSCRLSSLLHLTIHCGLHRLRAYSVKQ